MFVCCVYLQCNECSLMNLWLRCFRVDISVCFFLLLSFFYRMRSPIWITKQKSIFMKHWNMGIFGGKTFSSDQVNKVVSAWIKAITANICELEYACVRACLWMSPGSDMCLSENFDHESLFRGGEKLLPEVKSESKENVARRKVEIESYVFFLNNKCGALALD